MRRVGVVLTACAGCVALGLACNTLTGIDDLERVGFPDSEDAGDEKTSGDEPPTCTCVPEAPSGWTGPVLVVEGSPAKCPPGLDVTFDGGGAELAAPTACSPCACGAPSGACTAFAVAISGNAQCNNPCSNKPVTDQCSPVTACAPNTGIVATATISDASTCAPAGGAVVPATFARSAVGCTLAAAPGTCPTGQACAPSSSGCIFTTGDVACPPGAYASKRVYYRGVNDSRSCSPCSCGSPEGGCAGGEVTIYKDTACAKEIGTVGGGAGCKAVSGFVAPPGSAKITTPAEAGTGSCAPDGGVAAGSASPTSPTTFCCAGTL
jgi:hypothetical protein